MPFDPTLPVAHSTNSSAEMRAQLTALKAQLDAQAAQIAAQSGQIANLQGQLNAAIANTAQNIPGIGPLNLSIGNNPTQPSDVQPIADKVDELINRLFRP